ncbi:MULTISPECIES: hypothetical protein [unclassified Haloparvum]|uniref:hypothetical protein n=1 Tax=Haloparvum sp. PAK95 TaxID=3418962 RepID=UPI003D2F200E
MSSDSDASDAGAAAEGAGDVGGVEERGLVPGLAALLLFGVMSAVFVGADFGTPTGFELSGEAADTITHNIGYALLDLEVGSLAAATEGFLAAFIIVALTLDVAVDGALYLAKREEGGSVISAVGGAFTRGRKVDDGGER